MKQWSVGRRWALSKSTASIRQPSDRRILWLGALLSALAPSVATALPVLTAELATDHEYEMVVESYPSHPPYWPVISGIERFGIRRTDAGFSGDLIVSDRNQVIAYHFKDDLTNGTVQGEFAFSGEGEHTALFDTSGFATQLSELSIEWFMNPQRYGIDVRMQRRGFRADAVTSVVTEIPHADGPSQWLYEWDVRNDFLFPMNGFSIPEVGGLIPFTEGPIAPNEHGKAQLVSWLAPRTGNIDVLFVDGTTRAYARSNPVSIPVSLPSTLALFAIPLVLAGSARRTFTALA